MSARFKPTLVYRVQNAQGEGPYEAFDGGIPSSKMRLPEVYYENKPLPEDDFYPEDFKEFLGQDEAGNGAGYYLFGFKHARDAERWFGKAGIAVLYKHGYRVKEIPATKVVVSASGRQVFFEPKGDITKAKDASGFEHPEMDEDE